MLGVSASGKPPHSKSKKCPYPRAASNAWRVMLPQRQPPICQHLLAIDTRSFSSRRSRSHAVYIVVVSRIARRAVRVVEVGRATHSFGSSSRGAISTPISRQLRLRKVRTCENDDRYLGSDCCFLIHIASYRNRSSFLDCAARAFSRDLGLTNVNHSTISALISSNVPNASKTSDLKASPHDT